ncbi:MAG: FAD-dependent oxidoreductase, partial [Candidatus Binatia bacterium]
GGGLAGMTVAKELMNHGAEVVILEARHHLGGKAGSDKNQKKVSATDEHTVEVYEDHGYHIFPGWYANTRQLLEDLGCMENLIDIECFHVLRKGDWKKGKVPELSTLYPTVSPWQLAQTIRALARLLSVPDAISGFYGLLDLIGESFNNRVTLDRLSAYGFFSSRFYATEAFALFHSDALLQAASIPNYQISAMTLRKATNLWLAEDLSHWEWLPFSSSLLHQWLSTFLPPMPTHWETELPEEEYKGLVRLARQVVQQTVLPRRLSFKPQYGAPPPPDLSPRFKVYSILNNSLQEAFIEKFKDYLTKPRSGVTPVTIRTNCHVTELEIRGRNRVSQVNYRDQTGRVQKGETGDIFILATPPEATVKLLGQEFYEAEQRNSDAPEKSLSDLTHLETAPMASLHLYLKDPIPGLPKEHVNLLHSRYGLSFIDISQHWNFYKNTKPYGTVLSVIASNFEPLRVLLKDKSKDGIKNEDIPTTTRDELTEALIVELQKYLPLEKANIADRTVKPNLDAPLFLNSVGSWHFRPSTKTRLDNLY